MYENVRYEKSFSRFFFCPLSVLLLETEIYVRKKMVNKFYLG